LIVGRFMVTPSFRSHTRASKMTSYRTLVFLVLLIGNYQSWSINPKKVGGKNRFKKVLDVGSEVEGQNTGGVDFKGITNKDANPYADTYRNMLRDVGKLLTKEKIDWHITFGTLIGYQRMGKFLPYDEDLDIYVVDRPWDDKAKFDKFKTAVDELKKGYSFSYLGGPVYRVQKTKDKNMPSDSHGRGPAGEGTWVDLYNYADCDKDKKTCAGFEVPKGARLVMSNILPTKTCTIDTVECNCPQNPPYILSMYYGDWQNPTMQYCDGVWKNGCPKATVVAAKAPPTKPAELAPPGKPAPASKEIPATPGTSVSSQEKPFLSASIPAIDAALNEVEKLKLEHKSREYQISQLEHDIKEDQTMLRTMRASSPGALTPSHV